MPTLDAVRKENVRHIKTPKEYVALIRRYRAYFLNDIDQWDEATTAIRTDELENEVVYELVECFMKFFDGRGAIHNILRGYLTYHYHELFSSDKTYSDSGSDYTSEMRNVREYLTDPLLIAFSTDRNREQDGIAKHSTIWTNFVEAVIDVGTTNEYAGSIVTTIATKWKDELTPEQNWFNIRDLCSEEGYENTNEIADGIRGFIDYCYNLFSSTEFRSQFVVDVYHRYCALEHKKQVLGMLSNFTKAFSTDEESEDLFNNELYEIGFITKYFGENYCLEMTEKDKERKADLINRTRDGFARIAYRLGELYNKTLNPSMKDQYIKSCITSTIHMETKFFVNQRCIPELLKLVDEAVSHPDCYITKYAQPLFRVDELPEIEDAPDYAAEAYSKRSSDLQAAQTAIYHAYKNYKNSEEKVDSQISKMVQAAGRLAIGDVRTEIIEGKKFSAIGLLKKALSTAAIFSFGPLKGLIALVVRYALKKKVTASERRKIILEMEVELDMVNEKIEDAKGDGNRKAKYALMRTKAELEAALGKIKYGAEVDQRNLEGAKAALNKRIGG